MRQRTKNDKYQVWRHNLSPQLLSTFKSISRIICKMGHFYKRCQIQMDQRDNLSFRSNIYVQYIQIKFYFFLTEIFIMETIFVLQCQDVTQHVSINFYQVLFLVLRNITRLKSRHQFMLKIETTHLKRALSMPIMQMVDVFVFMLVLCVVLGGSHSQRQIH